MRFPFPARALLAACIAALCARTPAPAQGGALVKVYDSISRGPRFRLAAADSLLLERVVHPAARNHWRDSLENCSDEFAVLDAAAGSFTRRGARQRVFLYSYCYVSRVMGGLGGIAVVEAGRVVAHIPITTTAGGIYAAPDLDGNGRSELVLVDHEYHRGESWYSVSLAEIRPGARALRWLGGYKVGYEDCAADHARPRREAAVLFARPGKRPRFFQQRYTASCDDPPRWTRRGDLEAAEPREG